MKRISYPSKIDGWKTLEKYDPTIALNILYIKQKEICPAYISKIISNFEKQIILLMTPNEKKRRIPLSSSKKLPTLSTELT